MWIEYVKLFKLFESNHIYFLLHAFFYTSSTKLLVARGVWKRWKRSQSQEHGIFRTLAIHQTLWNVLKLWNVQLATAMDQFTKCLFKAKLVSEWNEHNEQRKVSGTVLVFLILSGQCSFLSCIFRALKLKFSRLISRLNWCAICMGTVGSGKKSPVDVRSDSFLVNNFFFENFSFFLFKGECQLWWGISCMDVRIHRIIRRRRCRSRVQKECTLESCLRR